MITNVTYWFCAANEPKNMYSFLFTLIKYCVCVDYLINCHISILIQQGWHKVKLIYVLTADDLPRQLYLRVYTVRSVYSCSKNHSPGLTAYISRLGFLSSRLGRNVKMSSFKTGICIVVSIYRTSLLMKVCNELLIIVIKIWKSRNISSFHISFSFALFSYYTTNLGIKKVPATDDRNSSNTCCCHAL
jgi:hypothetical protein